MSEEFVEDIIAATSSEEAVNNLETITNPEPVTTEEPKAESSEEPVTESVDETPTTDSEETVESLAKQLGWSPDHKGDAYVDAATYILKSRDIQDSMRDHNRDLKSQLSNMQGSIEALKQHNERVYRADVNRLQAELKELTKKKRAAVELADTDTVDSLDEQIDSVKKAINEPAPQSPAPSSNPVFDDWVKDNQWYLTDPTMAGYADQVAQQYVGAPADRIYKAVRNKVAELWPEKFEQSKQDNTQSLANVTKTEQPQTEKVKPMGPVSPVEGTTHASNAPKFGKADLTPDQLSIMKQFIGAGIMTEEQYINDIAKLQGA